MCFQGQRLFGGSGMAERLGEAVLIPEGRQLESPDLHAKITTAEVPLSKALDPDHTMEMFYEIRRVWL